MRTCTITFVLPDEPAGHESLMSATAEWIDSTFEMLEIEKIEFDPPLSKGEGEEFNSHFNGPVTSSIE
jgi:hypothetical protein